LVLKSTKVEFQLVKGDVYDIDKIMPSIFSKWYLSIFPGGWRLNEEEQDEGSE